MYTARNLEYATIIPASPAVRTVARVLLMGLCLEVAFSVGYRSFYLAVESVPMAWAAGLFMVALTFLLYALRRPIARACARAAGWGPGRFWFSGWLIFGLTARAAWALLLHTVPKADGATYFDEASNLVLRHSYAGGFFPPGLPLLEAPVMRVLGIHNWITILYELVAFAATYAAVYLLGKRLGGRTVAAIACALLAVWPNDIGLTGINEKEPLIMVLITVCFLLYVKSRDGQDAAQTGFLALAGILNGYAALTQPAYLLFPSVILLNELMGERGWFRALGRTALFAVAMLVAISPWTYRNFRVYHRFVLISTNGGSVFYRANNPLANGQYTYRGERVLPADDFAADKEGYRLAKLWIRQHPVDFAKLAVRKQVVYLGDESSGVYESMKRDREPSALVYGGCKLICNVFWMAQFAFLFVASSWFFRRRDWRIVYGLCVLPLLYQWCIDSVFEAGARHHGPYIGMISILVAIAVTSAVSEGIRGTEPDLSPELAAAASR